jgi:hypothetical protein
MGMAMTGFHPLGLAVLIIAVVSLAGMIAAMVRNHRKFRGYEDVAEDTRAIARKLGAEIFRDGPDLVISGNYQQLPAIIRLSHSENTPGVSIEMKVPAKFKFSLTPKQWGNIPAGASVTVSNLAATFHGRTDSPLEANQLTGSSSVKKALAGICWSNKVFLEISPGRLLMNELLIPSNLHDRVMDELQGGSVLSAELEKFPGADVRKIQIIKHDRTSWAFRGALAAGIVVTVAGIAQNAVNASNRAARVAPKEVASLIPRNDAILITRVRDWRPAEANDFDPQFSSWLQSYGIKPSYVVEFSADKARVLDSKAYFLVNDKGQKRVVAIVDHRVVFDAIFPSIAGLAIVPMDSVGKVQWPMSRAPFDKVPGDGLLVVRNMGQSAGANLLFFSGDNLLSGIPENYEHIDIQ